MCSHRYRYIKIYVSCGLQLLLELKSFQSNLHVHIPLPKDGDVMRCVFVADVDSCEKGMLICCAAGSQRSHGDRARVPSLQYCINP